MTRQWFHQAHDRLVLHISQILVIGAIIRRYNGGRCLTDGFIESAAAFRCKNDHQAVQTCNPNVSELVTLMYLRRKSRQARQTKYSPSTSAEVSGFPTGGHGKKVFVPKFQEILG